MKANRQPETPTPFALGHPGNVPPCTPQQIHEGPHAIVSTGVKGYQSYQFAKATRRTDAEFLIHAGNAYEKMVLALRYALNVRSDPTCTENPCDRARRVLEEIGESEE